MLRWICAPTFLIPVTTPLEGTSCAINTDERVVSISPDGMKCPSIGLAPLPPGPSNSRIVLLVMTIYATETSSSWHWDETGSLAACRPDPTTQLALEYILFVLDVIKVKPYRRAVPIDASWVFSSLLPHLNRGLCHCRRNANALRCLDP
ncbi:hypothetical protein EDD37DRAFT_306205 [Exophiala viscosa]|uniref:uncharacterized protein n=1 Tax=Exophiala viscosa TaxID=2486360 RepID=UPI002193A4F6|nr:hypothetical protein EDD37DRAFT_306205 [Exophiala viscosa]